MSGVLKMYTIYHQAADVIEPYCVREWLITSDDSPRPGRMWTADDLPGAREQVPEEATARLARSDGDSPTVVETWL